MIGVKLATPFCVTILLLACVDSFAQQKSEFKADQFGAGCLHQAGWIVLESGHVILKDAKGFRWVGSGWCQPSHFNGMTFQRFISEPKKVLRRPTAIEVKQQRTNMCDK